MSVSGLEEHLKRKTPSKENIRKAEKEQFEKHEPQVFVRFKIIRYPYYVASKPLNITDWGHVYLELVKQGVQVDPPEDVKREMARISAIQRQREEPKIQQRQRESEVQKARINNPFYKLCQAIKYHRTNPTFLEDFETKFAEEEKRKAYQQFLKSTASRAYDPALTDRAIDFGILYCKQRLDNPKEEPSNLLKKVGELFRWR